jgi:hypothetical protein
VSTIRMSANSTRALRKAFSTLELIVALALLTSVVASVGKYASYVQRGIRDRQLAQQLHWELVNTRELIASWKIAEVTKQRIESLPISAQLVEQLTQASWLATVEPESAVAAFSSDVLAVTLQFRANLRDQAIRPLELKFWVAPPATQQQPSQVSQGSLPACLPSDTFAHQAIAAQEVAGL